MDLKSLSDEQLLESARAAAKNERHTTTVVLHHLLEVYDRRLFSPKYPSLHAYAVGDLKYNDGEAQRRINAMRVLRAIPEVAQKIDSGSLNLTALSQAQVFFRQEAKVDGPATAEAKRELLLALENKSTREVDRELISRATEPAALQPDRVRVVSDTLSELKCFITDETLEDLKKIRGLLAHKYPNFSMGELLSLVAKIALKELDPSQEPKRKRRLPAQPAPEVSEPRAATPAREVSKPRKASRYVPAGVKREVWKKADGKCQTCGSFHRLQIDHTQPHSLGGPSELENLRLLCFHCNQREADRKLGRSEMEIYRKQIQTPQARGLADGIAAHISPL